MIQPISMISRRQVLAVALSAAGAGRAISAPSAGSDALFADVVAYDQLGEHRSGTTVDAATSHWLRQRLSALGFDVELQSFEVPLFEPRRCELALDGSAIEAFPAWPVAQTPGGGIRAPLVAADAAPLAGKIALVPLAYGRGGDWAQPRLGEPVMRAARQAAAVVALTEGPTGLPIAMNAAPGRYDWPVPVVIVGGAETDRLARAAAAGAPVTLVSTGTLTPRATATNVIARRRGDGRTLVVSTPKSGWFHCAGERGSGIALYLALAASLASRTHRDLLFVATSGHELGELGAAQMLASVAPPPDRAAGWLHIGADVAVDGVARESGVLQGTGEPVTDRRLFVGAGLAEAAARAFAGQSGYANPDVIGGRKLPGELERIRAAGQSRIAGLVGSGPLFHTRLDRAKIATTPAILAPVAQGVLGLAMAMLEVH